jgi:hypothetical protein
MHLADVLDAELETGRCQIYADTRQATITNAPPIACQFCKGTGRALRDGSVSIVAFRLGETAEPVELPYCPMCDGQGKRPASDYAFSVENVREFTAFLRDCGGVVIK